MTPKPRCNGDKSRLLDGAQHGKEGLHSHVETRRAPSACTHLLGTKRLWKMQFWVKEGSSKARIAQRRENHQGPALPCPGIVLGGWQQHGRDCPAPRPSGNLRGCYNLDSTSNNQIKRGIKWQPRIHPLRLHAPGLQVGCCATDAVLPFLLWKTTKCVL